MIVNEDYFRAIWHDQHYEYVEIIDQTLLPFQFEIVRIEYVTQMVNAIKTMQVRGAPLIGAAAAYGIALAMRQNSSDENLLITRDALIQSRPTAVNLAWAVERVVKRIRQAPMTERIEVAWLEAKQIADEDVAQNQAIGQHGLTLIKQLHQHQPVNILTHCNAGWLATVDYGTALAPVYAAHDAGIAVHVWVDETRPRNQGASLTAWELAQHGVPHTVISDNAGGHYMQHGLVDMVIVGADRVTSSGDVCNKIGTYLKALAAYDNQVPFYVAVPSPTLDLTIQDGLTEIEIEARSGDEVAYIQGQTQNGTLETVRLIPDNSRAANPAFDITPARLVTGIITEKGIYLPNQLAQLA